MAESRSPKHDPEAIGVGTPAVRAESMWVRDEMITALRAARRLAHVVAEGGASAPTGRTAFTALPAPAAMIDPSGLVAAVNPAWRASRLLGPRIPVGVDFGAAWSTLSGDDFVADALSQLAVTTAPAQLEITLPGTEPTRVLVEIGPAAVPDGIGALVVVTDLTTYYQRQQRLLFEATHDPLTGVANRTWLQRALEEALDRLRRYKERFALIYLDIDEFNAINDNHGHAVGDAVLQEVARRWRAVVRRPDLLARVGGDEFVVLVWHVNDLRSVDRLAKRLKKPLEEPVTVDALDLHLRVTAGIAAPPADVDVDHALALADQQMYTHKPR